jgi:hypothetical protein
MRRRPRIREGLLKALEEPNHLVSAPQHPRLGPGGRQPILEPVGERGVSGSNVALVPGSIPSFEGRSECSKELGLGAWHRGAKYPSERQPVSALARFKRFCSEILDLGVAPVQEKIPAEVFFDRREALILRIAIGAHSPPSKADSDLPRIRATARTPRGPLRAS